ncbi:D-glycero-beta-D-manno-heptose 1-phosphate adenylyltransferase [Streptomyces griseomycini]|uniref:D-glycero-beta-D-manno-heptose 1-phosphate adenylyltransferase n=1 Tax=Streptomyces griseomycini TaxID=66895 RepID=A0A7W7PS75_9ACTN|nr:D-glycero-beta-D-manno-heptose 1-phosphate adenylyltransferase [Streptomyces griseomycini]MBB4898805.1 rfaE bifunctional protein nucleotidyltransferase chain/domain [Streptomyces griseomycini]GGQ04088.1 bifunctional protein HldE [Streptomyces griseomycini]GGR18465.1 bifunctional protein HldE [Streptomyces griseomycini]
MNGKAPLVVVGDALLDRDLTGRADRLAPDAPVPVVDDYGERTRPGGAALTAYLAARDGREVTLVAGVGDDSASRELRRLLTPWVTLVPLPLTGPLPEKSRVLAADRPVARLDRGSGRACEATDRAREVVRAAPAVLVSDYGRGTADVLRDVLAARPPLLWDPHPRGGPPVPGTRLVTPAEKEALALAPDGATPRRDLAAAARSAAALVRHWKAAAVAVTLGARGALLSYGEHPLLVPASAVHHGDSCGAGDRFAATAAGLLADGALVGEAVEAAVAAATDFVGAGGAGALPRPDAVPPPADGDDPFALADRIRTAHGTVVAAGGCFDLLHAGHVGLLQAARGLGDCLVVCVNSDASVRRRKGAGRPVNPLADRVRVLRALACVDAVAVFDEDTPERLLADLRPDVWVKGGDYAAADLPEAALLEEWGGQAVLLPYLDGRSSTRMLERAAEGTR